MQAYEMAPGALGSRFPFITMLTCTSVEPTQEVQLGVLPGLG